MVTNTSGFNDGPTRLLLYTNVQQLLCATIHTPKETGLRMEGLDKLTALYLLNVS